MTLTVRIESRRKGSGGADASLRLWSAKRSCTCAPSALRSREARAEDRLIQRVVGVGDRVRAAATAEVGVAGVETEIVAAVGAAKDDPLRRDRSAVEAPFGKCGRSGWDGRPPRPTRLCAPCPPRAMWMDDRPMQVATIQRVTKRSPSSHAARCRRPPRSCEASPSRRPEWSGGALPRRSLPARCPGPRCRRAPAAG